MGRAKERSDVSRVKEEDEVVGSQVERGQRWSCDVVKWVLVEMGVREELLLTGKESGGAVSERKEARSKREERVVGLENLGG